MPGYGATLRRLLPAHDLAHLHLPQFDGAGIALNARLAAQADAADRARRYSVARCAVQPRRAVGDQHDEPLAGAQCRPRGVLHTGLCRPFGLFSALSAQAQHCAAADRDGQRPPPADIARSNKSGNSTNGRSSAWWRGWPPRKASKCWPARLNDVLEQRARRACDVCRATQKCDR